MVPRRRDRLGDLRVRGALFNMATVGERLAFTTRPFGAFDDGASVRSSSPDRVRNSASPHCSVSPVEFTMSANRTTTMLVADRGRAGMVSWPKRNSKPSRTASGGVNEELVSMSCRRAPGMPAAIRCAFVTGMNLLPLGCITRVGHCTAGSRSVTSHVRKSVSNRRNASRPVGETERYMAAMSRALWGSSKFPTAARRFPSRGPSRVCRAGRGSSSTR